MMKRVLSIWLPQWPLQRRKAVRPELSRRSVVLYRQDGQRGWRVVLSSSEASEAGVRPGMPLAEVKAFLERDESYFELHDPQEDRTVLCRLAQWCQQFSPLVGLDDHSPVETLLLDITGCAPVFHGEVNLARTVLQAFEQRRLLVRVALADTIGAAWAISHYGNYGRQTPFLIAPPQLQERFLRPLPIESLRLEKDNVRQLHGLGIHRVHQLQALPRSSLPSRFGSAILTRLDQAMGHAAELLVPEHPMQPIIIERHLEYPLSDHRTLRIVVKQLIQQALNESERNRQGIQQFVFQFHTVEKKTCCFTVGLTRPSRTLSHLTALAFMQMDDVTLAPDVIRVRLRVTETSALSTSQRTLFDSDDHAARRRHFHSFIDRLSNRLGERSVLRPILCADAQPEFVSRWDTVLKTRPVATTAEPLAPTIQDACFDSTTTQRTMNRLRPCRLKRQPIPIEVVSVFPEGPPLRFRWHNKDHVMTRHWGPERIETGWWRDRQVRRDYYRVETTQGRQFWLFRHIADGTWFLHGEFD